MESSALEKARQYETAHGEEISGDERPEFHVSPTVGWLNDPNGFSYYNGKYHLFYQYNPYSTHWASMHWGHLVSDDMIRWERMPAAMAPDKEYDNAGVWSGSAIELPDGRHMLMYTGMHEQLEDDGSVITRQTQCVAFGDGLDYEKYEGNPVIDPDSLPEGSSTSDFRDPKIWWDEEDKCFYAVLCSDMKGVGGAVVLYKSTDMHNWSYVSTLDKSDNQFGIMWECPDFFRLDDEDVMIVSPMEMRAEGLEFHNGQNVAYFLGKYDKKNFKYERKEIHSLDYGLDFYAPQSLLAPDGRRILIAWMQSPENQFIQPRGVKWYGQLSIPRELSIRDGRLVQTPIREIEQYRRNKVYYKRVYVRERLCLPGVIGRCIDMTLNIRPAGGTLYQKFVIKVAKDSELYTSITYDPHNSVLRFDRSHCGFQHDVIATRKAHVHYDGGRIRLRILMDRYSVEIFVNDGEQSMSSTLFSDLNADDISFEAVGSAIMEVEKYDIQL